MRHRGDAAARRTQPVVVLLGRVRLLGEEAPTAVCALGGVCLELLALMARVLGCATTGGGVGHATVRVRCTGIERTPARCPRASVHTRPPQAPCACSGFTTVAATVQRGDRVGVLRTGELLVRLLFCKEADLVPYHRLRQLVQPLSCVHGDRWGAPHATSSLKLDEGRLGSGSDSAVEYVGRGRESGAVSSQCVGNGKGERTCNLSIVNMSSV